MLSHARQPRVLVVDDNAELAETIADGLLEHGYQAQAVTSGEAALQLLRTERIDALITDVRMPRMDGFTLLRSAVALDPSRPVIVMTAYGSVSSALEAAIGGGWQYLIKPFRIEQLAGLLRQSLGESRVR
jgi:DNA-binding NtrC family response regulator